MELIIFFKVFFICLLGAMSPGPSWVLVVNNSLVKGKLNGIATSLGHGIGITIYALIANLGIVLLLKINIFYFSVIQFSAVLFLLYLGVKSFNSKLVFNKNDIYPQNASFLQGFFMAILNPKIFIWFTAIYSQFISSTNSFVFNSILVAIAGIVDAIWYILLVLLVTSRPVLTFLKNKGYIFGKVVGIIFIFIGILLLVRLFYDF